LSNTVAIKEVLDFTVFKYSTGAPLFTVDYAKQSNVSTTAERLSIRGGQGNYKIIDLDHTKDCTFGAMLPIVDVNALAVKLGVDVTTGAKTAPNKQILTAGASNTITLAATPLAGTLKLYALENERDLGTVQVAGTPASVENTYSLAGRVITLNATTGATGNKFIAFYDYTSGTTAQNIKITASELPNFIYITGRGIMDDDQEGQKIPVSFKIHKAKVKPEFTLTMAGTEATEIDFTTDCYSIYNSDGVREYCYII